MKRLEGMERDIRLLTRSLNPPPAPTTKVWACPNAKCCFKRNYDTRLLCFKCGAQRPHPATGMTAEAKPPKVSGAATAGAVANGSQLTEGATQRLSATRGGTSQDGGATQQAVIREPAQAEVDLEADIGVLQAFIRSAKTQPQTELVAQQVKQWEAQLAEKQSQLKGLKPLHVRLTSATARLQTHSAKLDEALEEVVAMEGKLQEAQEKVKAIQALKDQAEKELQEVQRNIAAGCQEDEPMEEEPQAMALLKDVHQRLRQPAQDPTAILQAIMKLLDQQFPATPAPAPEPRGRTPAGNEGNKQPGDSDRRERTPRRRQQQEEAEQQRLQAAAEAAKAAQEDAALQQQQLLAAGATQGGQQAPPPLQPTP